MPCPDAHARLQCRVKISLRQKVVFNSLTLVLNDTDNSTKTRIKRKNPDVAVFDLTDVRKCKFSDVYSLLAIDLFLTMHRALWSRPARKEKFDVTFAKFSGPQKLEGTLEYEAAVSGSFECLPANAMKTFLFYLQDSDERIDVSRATFWVSLLSHSYLPSLLPVIGIKTKNYKIVVSSG